MGHMKSHGWEYENLSRIDFFRLILSSRHKCYTGRKDILGYICAYDKSRKTLAAQGFWN